MTEIRKRWSEEENTHLASLIHEQNLSAREAAEVLERSTDAIKLQCRKLGLKPRDSRGETFSVWTDDRVSRLQDLVTEKSYSLQECADDLGLSKNAIRLQCRKMEIKPRDTRGAARTVWTEERIAWLRTELTTKPVSQVVAESGMTDASIRSAIDDYGISRMSRAAANKSEWRRKNLSDTAQAKYAVKFPPEGPWKCYGCSKFLPVTDFPDYGKWKRCFTCQNEHRVSTRYNITIEQYRQMLKDQGEVCATCKRPETKVHMESGRLHALSVDHDHTCCPGKTSCGKCVRGLLCTECNHGIGKLEKQGVDLEVLAKYLLKKV